MAFLVGSTTVLPALSNFCVFAFVGVLFVFVYMNTFFLAMFALDQRRLEARRDGILCCLRKEEDWKPSRCSQRDFSSVAFAAYARALLHPAVK